MADAGRGFAGRVKGRPGPLEASAVAVVAGSSRARRSLAVEPAIPVVPLPAGWPPLSVRAAADVSSLRAVFSTRVGAAAESAVGIRDVGALAAALPRPLAEIAFCGAAACGACAAVLPLPLASFFCSCCCCFCFVFDSSAFFHSPAILLVASRLARPLLADVGVDAACAPTAAADADAVALPAVTGRLFFRFGSVGGAVGTVDFAVATAVGSSFVNVP